MGQTYLKRLDKFLFVVTERVEKSGHFIKKYYFLVNFDHKSN